MIIKDDLTQWFIEHVKQLIVDSHKTAKSNNWYDGPQETLFDSYQSMQYVAMHITEHFDYSESSKWFAEHGCSIKGYEREKHHLMAQIRDGQGMLSYKILYPSNR